MLVREGNKISIVRESYNGSQRTDELLKGLIGRVNLSKKDLDDMVTKLSSKYGKIQWDNAGAYIFGYGRTTKEEDVSIRIGEGKNKLYVIVKVGNKENKKDGLRPNDISSTLSTFLKNVNLSGPQFKSKESPKQDDKANKKSTDSKPTSKSSSGSGWRVKSLADDDWAPTTFGEI